MQTRAILLIYEGEVAPDDAFVIDLQRAVGAQSGAETVNAVVFNQQEIAQVLLASEHVSGVVKTMTKVAKNPRVENTPEDKAIIYFGTILAHALAKPFDKKEFTGAVLNAYLRLESEEEKKRFDNALEILSGEDLKISKSLMDKYNFTKQKIAVFNTLYGFISRW